MTKIALSGDNPAGINAKNAKPEDYDTSIILDPTFTDWTTPEGLLVIKQWRRDGVKITDIAKKIGVQRQTLYAWANKSDDFAEAMRSGHIEAVAMIESRFFANAMRSKRTQDQINWLKYNHRAKYYEEAPREAAKVQEEGTGVEKLLERLDAQLLPDDPNGDDNDETSTDKRKGL